MSEDVKAMAEKLMGVGRSKPEDIKIRKRKIHMLRFKDDGETPNNPRFPVLIYRSPVRLNPDCDPAAIFETLFKKHCWRKSWRDGIYPFLHFHTRTHEVLGFARGWVKIRLGGGKGRIVMFKAGDIAILPAGTGHRRIGKSADLLVVGAYPARGAYDEPRPGEISHAKAVAAISRVGAPPQDPVYGAKGGLRIAWRR